jgi:hypothetical protein
MRERDARNYMILHQMQAQATALTEKVDELHTSIPKLIGAYLNESMNEDY